MDARRLPSVIFVIALVFGVLAKLWRAVDLYLEADAVDGLRWLPFGIGSELLVAGVLALLIGLIARLNIWVAGVAMGMSIGGELFWLALNDVSFRISQIGISFARLRGDEGVGIKDFHLMAAGDVYPALAYVAVALVTAIALAAVVYRRGPILPTRALVAVVVVGSVAWAADIFWLSAQNFGMGESPVLLMARTYVAAFAGREEVVLPHTVPTPTTKEGRLALLRTQEPQPPTTAPQKKQPTVHNGVLWFSEGIARKQTGLEGAGVDGLSTTPNLIKALDEMGGLDLENYYTTYHKSIAAIYSMTCSDYPPPDSRNIMEMNPRIDCGSLPEVLSKNGVHVGLFHGGDFGFYDKLQLLGDRGFEIQKDARAIAGNGVWEYGWGVDDRAVVDTVLAWIDSLPKGDRFFAVIIPITAHYPYQIPPDVKPAFPGTSAKSRFYSAVHFLDDAFGRLNDGLKKRDVQQDTAVIYMADHGETVAERPRAQAGRRLAYEPSLHVPMVILAPSMFDSWQKNQRVGSHVDLLPTVLDLMGLPADARHHGRSLVSADFEPRRVFIGANNGPKYVGFVDGKQKFIVNRQSGLRELYDLTADPFEQHNLAGDHAEKAERLTAEAVAFADGQLAWLKGAPSLPGDVDVQQSLLELAAVRVVKNDGSIVECPRPPSAEETPPSAASDPTLALDRLPFRRVCPGFANQPFLGARHHKAGRVRSCVLVNVPEGGGAVEIRLGAQPWLPFLTRVRAAIGRTDVKAGDHIVLTAYGDGKQGQQKGMGHGETLSTRVAFPSSSNELVVRVSGEQPMSTPLCLTFTEKAWRVGLPPASEGEKSPAHEDDAHGAQPQQD